MIQRAPSTIEQPAVPTAGVPRPVTPFVRRRAAELGVDLGSLRATTRTSSVRVTVDEVETAVPRTTATGPSEAWVRVEIDASWDVPELIRRIVREVARQSNGDVAVAVRHHRGDMRWTREAQNLSPAGIAKRLGDEAMDTIPDVLVHDLTGSGVCDGLLSSPPAGWVTVVVGDARTEVRYAETAGGTVLAARELRWVTLGSGARLETDLVALAAGLTTCSTGPATQTRPPS